MSIKNLPVKNKLLLMLILPMLGIFSFSSLMLIDKFSQYSSSKTLIEDSYFFAEIGAAVHNLQKERGTTVGFVSSHGAKMGDKLPALRIDSDKTIDVLIIDIKKRTHENDKNLKNTIENLKKLSELRNQADKFAIDVLTVASQYTTIIQTLL